MSDKLSELIENAAREGQELQNKEHELRVNKVENQYQKLQESKKLEKDIKNASFKEISSNQGLEDSVIESLDRYQDRSLFINKDFEGKIDLYPSSLTAVGASTGNGKSTCGANIALSTLEQGKKVIILTNEETKPDYYMRVACLALGLNFNDRNNFTEMQRGSLILKISELERDVTVIDDNALGQRGTTTTLIGVQSIFEKLARSDELKNGGVLIFDYFQNITSVKAGEHNYGTLKKLCDELRSLKDIFPVAIVVLVQMRMFGIKKGDKFTDYRSRIRDCKEIADNATSFVEIYANKETRITTWYVHKSRFNSFSGAIATKWDYGRYVKVKDPIEKILEEQATAVSSDNGSTDEV